MKEYQVGKIGVNIIDSSTSSEFLKSYLTVETIKWYKLGYNLLNIHKENP